MNVYFYKGENKRNIFSELLVKKALELYNIEYDLGRSLEEIDQEKIGRTQKGKPYFNRIPLEFSISHSGNIWVCAMGECRVGTDIQIEKTARTLEIAKRFFTKEESDFVSENGTAAFFQIWSMKEAFVKYTGEGISYGFDKFSVVIDGKVTDSMENPIKCRFQKIELTETLECYICTAKKEKVCKRNICKL